MGCTISVIQIHILPFIYEADKSSKMLHFRWLQKTGLFTLVKANVRPSEVMLCARVSISKSSRRSSKSRSILWYRYVRSVKQLNGYLPL